MASVLSSIAHNISKSLHGHVKKGKIFPRVGGKLKSSWVEEILFPFDYKECDTIPSCILAAIFSLMETRGSAPEF
jgi:hypothetical protein